MVVIERNFAGLRLIRKINPKDYQVKLLDKVNYHQFQPILYAVIMKDLFVSVCR
jgi:NADH dehydrogenase